jgi:hypothetical protein
VDEEGSARPNKSQSQCDIHTNYTTGKSVNAEYVEKPVVHVLPALVLHSDNTQVRTTAFVKDFLAASWQ